MDPFFAQSMVVEGKVHPPNDDLAAIKTTHKEIISIQERTIGKMNSIQDTLDALILKVDNQFEEKKAYFGRMKEAKDEGLLRLLPPATIVPIKAYLEYKETVVEADLEGNETKSAPVKGENKANFKRKAMLGYDHRVS